MGLDSGSPNASNVRMLWQWTALCNSKTHENIMRYYSFYQELVAVGTVIIWRPASIGVFFTYAYNNQNPQENVKLGIIIIGYAIKKVSMVSKMDDLVYLITSKSWYSFHDIHNKNIMLTVKFAATNLVLWQIAAPL